jgi:glutamyl/glutaminyl-tRNA synthetase
LGDFVIAKSRNEPIFHLVNVIDDYESGVTHVIRGEDHISNTPRHILIYEAIGAPLPLFAHIPLLLAKDRSKLSKRNSAVPLTDYRSRGYIPEAVVNYITLLGWHPADNREFLSRDDILKEFSLERIQKGGAIFDEEKLRWFNRHYLMKLSDADFVEHAKPFLPEWLSSTNDVFKRMVSLIRDKIYTLADISTLFENKGELSFVRTVIPHDKELLLWKKDPDPVAAGKHLMKCQELLETVPNDDFTAERVKEAVWTYAEENGKGNVLWPLRVSLTGQEKSPDPFISAALLGKQESLSRIGEASKKLAS